MIMSYPAEQKPQSAVHEFAFVPMHLQDRFDPTCESTTPVMSNIQILPRDYKEKENNGGQTPDRWYKMCIKAWHMK